VRKLLLVSLAVAGIAGAAPAQAQERRPAPRPPCPENAQCTECGGDNAPCIERRGLFPWFHLGQDEGARTRRLVRRLSLED
jgi:hypothetical protein